MVWRSCDPQGNEAGKVKLDLVPYMRGVVLDLGCGPQKIFPTAIGVDDDRDLKIFGIKAHFDVRADVERLPFVDGYADTVFSSHTLEHIVDYRAALTEWWRVVKPGGYLVLYLPHADWYPNRGMPGSNPDHKHDFRNDDVTKAMLAAARGQAWRQIADEVRSGGMEYSFLQIYQKIGGDACYVYQANPSPEKTIALVSIGAHGDALWTSALLPHFKREGWHVTVYVAEEGEAALKADPHIDRLVVQPKKLFGEGGEEVVWQCAYWLHEEKKYDRFINLTGCVERNLLAHQSDWRFYFAKWQRDLVMNGNYLEALHAWAGVPFDPRTVRVRFYPTEEERAWALAERVKYPGALVMINPSGSSLPKFWPHVQRLMELLDAQGIYSLVVGDPRHAKWKAPPRGRVVGRDWDIRRVFALAQLANVVVGTESALVNAVAHEPMLKVVLLSHSSHENLTRDWVNTAALAPQNLACYPCHRIHQDPLHCSMPRGFAACQDAATAEEVFALCQEWLARMREAA